MQVIHTGGGGFSNLCFLNQHNSTSEMPQWPKLLHKPNYLGFSPRTPHKERKKHPPCYPLANTHALWHVHRLSQAFFKKIKLLMTFKRSSLSSNHFPKSQHNSVTLKAKFQHKNYRGIQKFRSQKCFILPLCTIQESVTMCWVF